MARSFRWRGQRWEVDSQDLLDRARRIVEQDPPEEALRYRDWAVDVGGQPVSVKWLFALATGASQQEFDSPTARRALAQIGIESYRVNKGAQDMDTSRSSTREEKFAMRGEFLRQVVERLSGNLPAQARHGEFKLSSYWLKVCYPEFGGMHYELLLGRDHDEIAIHFESGREVNRDRMSVFETEVDWLSETLGYPVIAEPWGENWAHVAIVLDKAPWTREQAEIYAGLLARFIDATFDLLKQAYIKRPPRRRKKGMVDTTGRKDTNAHTTLDQKIATIREFLQGRSSSRPSDEVLCDWVQFCYTFELYAEGHQLFDLVEKSAVNDWFYERTRRLAKVCRLKSQ